jgi:hypothetical protein
MITDCIDNLPETFMADKTSTTEEDPRSVSGVGRAHQDIATAAYYIAERRGFEGGLHVEDWLEAERGLGARHEGSERDELAAREHVEEDIKPDEIQRWAEELHVSPKNLRIAIHQVGPNSTSVKQFLQSSASDQTAESG